MRETGMGRRTWLVVLGVGLALVPIPAAAKDRAPLGARIRIEDPRTASTLESVLDGARRRLERPFCEEVLTDFTDAAGHPLRYNLRTLAPTPAGYLALIHFVDGAETAACRHSGATAVTTPGSRVVWVCGRRMMAHAREDRRAVEIVVIHELLHTLGLGENPPTSGAISVQVAWRCGGG